nr:hypothetical protein [Tanacetum cinerariifolium]
MQEFWVTATVHHHSIQFKMDNKKHIVNLDSFREMLHIFPRLHHKPFVEPPFEEKILAFFHFLRHSAVIRKLTDVNINKLHQPWRAFAAITNKCLTGKSSGYDSLRYKEEQRDVLSSVHEGYHPPLHVKGSFYSKEEQDEGTGSIQGVSDVPTDESEKELSWNSTDEEGDDDEGKDGDGDDDGEEGDGDDDEEDDDGEEGNDDDDDQEVDRDYEKDDEEESGDDEQASDEEEFIHPSLSTHAEEKPRDEKSFDPILKTHKDTDDEGNGEENLGLNVGREEGHGEEDEEHELYKDTTSQIDTQTPTSVTPLLMSTPTLTSSTIATITTTQQAPLPPTTASSTLLQDLPNFGSLFGFDNRLKTLEENFSEFMKTNQFAGAVSTILGIVHRYMDQRMNE